ncbi:HNH endonuclease [Antarctobacter heliothermus]|uniref:HNH endonuclease n=1 Tax=Antarctobacter heliothermus TaxID=74033 RepID=UPI00113173D7|nr:HNH endonuclease [Antarctobacter heliothermus]
MLPGNSVPICGFPGYHVTPAGQVWSTRGKDGSVGKRPARVLKGSLSDGYPRVTLCIAGKRKRLFVHRLVAETFLGPCPDGLEVAHLNGDRRDSRLTNLRYVTRSENHLHKIGHGTMPMGNSHPNRSITEKTARQIGERLRDVTSYNRVAEEFGTTPGVVSQIATGRNWRHVFPKDWKPPARRRLSRQQRAEILNLAADGERQVEIAERFGVTQSAISHLLKQTARSSTHG